MWAYISKSLNEMECNYEIHDKEILAVIRDISEITEINLNSYISFFFFFLYLLSK